MAPTQVIIGFSDAISAPEVVWSLHDASYSVILISKKGNDGSSESSRFVKTIKIENPTKSTNIAVEDLCKVLECYPDAYVIALDDQFLRLLKLIQQKNINVRCSNNTNAICIALDKSLQIQHAIKAGFNVPNTLILDSFLHGNPYNSYPCVLKPALANHIEDDVLSKGDFFAFSNQVELDHQLKTSSFNYPMLLQQYISGIGEGVFGVFYDGKISQPSGHRRLRMMNPAGSGSSACERVVPSEDILISAEKFLSSIGWRGMFMIELLRDANGKLWFMEFNGRSWGSMALARRNGLEYPAWEANAYLFNNLNFSIKQDRMSSIARHIGRELMHFLFVLKGPKTYTEHWPKIWPTFLSMFNFGKDVGIYNWRTDDKRVFFVDTWIIIKTSIIKLLPHKIFKKMRIRLSTLYLKHTYERDKQLESAFKLLEASKSVTFVCYGNINRSVFSHKYFESIFADRFSTNSCGFHPHSNRPADSTMVRLASEKSLNLNDWTSKTINQKILDESDIVFVMEFRHLALIKESFPSAYKKTILLGIFSSNQKDPIEVSDPYGLKEDEYRYSIEHMTRCINGMK